MQEVMVGLVAVHWFQSSKHNSTPIIYIYNYLTYCKTISKTKKNRRVSKLSYADYLQTLHTKMR